MFQTGERAPEVELPDADMNIIRLSGYRDSKHVVLFFYVRDNTPACTAEAIEFSDLEAEFGAMDCAVVGVSRDDCLSHGVFRDSQGITVPLLADKEMDACRAYHVLVRKEVDGVLRDSVQRSTFVIDKRGVIRHALYGVNAKGHAKEVLALVKEL